jgi:hypothetical protein
MVVCLGEENPPKSSLLQPAQRPQPWQIMRIKFSIICNADAGNLKYNFYKVFHQTKVRCVVGSIALTPATKTCDFMTTLWVLGKR